MSTVKVTFVRDGAAFEMLFGDSYRTWDDQLDEYCFERLLVPVSFTISRTAWISLGGLKWCHISEFQNQLDGEGDGRLLSDFVFEQPKKQAHKKFEAVQNKHLQRAHRKSLERMEVPQ